MHIMIQTYLNIPQKYKKHNHRLNLYYCKTYRLSTVGIGSCLWFIILLDDGRIFVEHRSDTYFSSNFTTKNVRLGL
ncbi:unnamed protein product, partial [Rotaria socialis]